MSSMTRSRFAESDTLPLQSVPNSDSRPSHTGWVSDRSRLNTQFRLPWRVLISPLWPIIRMGWARGHLGLVLVENRRW